LKAIFLDRDGTINEDVNYLCRKSDIKILDGVIESLKSFRELGFLNIIVTNQSAVARGMITPGQLHEIHEAFNLALTSEGKKLIDDIYYSPYHPDGKIGKYSIVHPDTKPGIGMLLKAKEKYNLDFEQCYMIGDMPRDIETGNRAGVKSILIGAQSIDECKQKNLSVVYVARDLSDACDYIYKKITGHSRDTKV
jgi:D-glycero-D-manno-heptose 1,7-bisphosphate phosphatase